MYTKIVFKINFEHLIMEVSGLEPLTPAVQKQCSTNWAIPPLGHSGFEPETLPLSGVRSNQLS